ncbi:MAG: TIGR03619 family F420-dependent LLM class oxidoreductase [Aigarchaeota archaeon]|nr:TIGR03619 family F420-dependent LLM class oxidoreductase [Aigarchaeota archaeon]MDW8093227.1 TIGR03619 family F420-dependent LLM class oxidoreductase [Nitrososphaerota archaeon]
MSVQIGVCLPHYGEHLSRELVVRSAQLAEELGFDSIWTSDHIAISKQFSHPYGNITESLMTLSYVGGLTERVKLGTSVIVLPLRNTLQVAKQIATLDFLTNGRTIIGIGLGWERREFEVMGASYARRGEIIEEQIGVLRNVWRSSEPSFQGKYHDIRDVVFSPLPVQSGGPPILMAGNSERAAARAIRLCYGWHPTGVPVDKYRDLVEKYGMRREGFILSGRFTIDPDKRTRLFTSHLGDIRVIIGGSVDEVIEYLSRYVELGVSNIVVYMGEVKKDEYERRMRWFMREVSPSIKRGS